ncbi:hypothetical protein TorRG33x02_287290, partial [Trema orientale]
STNQLLPQFSPFPLLTTSSSSTLSIYIYIYLPISLSLSLSLSDPPLLRSSLICIGFCSVLVNFLSFCREKEVWEKKGKFKMWEIERTIILQMGFFFFFPGLFGCRERIVWEKKGKFKMWEIERTVILQTG